MRITQPGQRGEANQDDRRSCTSGGAPRVGRPGTRASPHRPRGRGIATAAQPIATRPRAIRLILHPESPYSLARLFCRNQRIRRKNEQISFANSSGCSKAAKWPPLAGSPQ